ncbi:hypothetical protein JAAARDRAFT_30797 [Jaapia argillacea MUCL 33604]|uniref:F-box domain-containing protein n=1 Tax=Jaapia argillacea MUCL 33604 TaxID=933084 RepID=A0A067QFJ1_9AGAM|nr:hypothetical protein JAAARDRAFT_30797 [Jaapia argillacea MUCL 33604]
MPSIADIPVEILLDNLLPEVQTRDLLSLGTTNRFFAKLCNDNTFWKRKIQDDFNFSGANTARTAGWKFIYKGLSRPKIFVWGEKANGRLGLSNFPRDTFGEGVPFPTELHIPGVRIVSLAAGGMSFHALDSLGHVYVWGTLNATFMALQSDGFSIPQKVAPVPLRLDLPLAIRAVSCGRLHASALDANGSVWTFENWGRPFRLLSPLLDNSSPDSTPEQIECGWSFSSTLTRSGDVLVWWPFQPLMHDRIETKNAEMDAEGNKRAEARNGVIQCVPWDLVMDPIRLPHIPHDLPYLTGTAASQEVLNADTKLVKIASADNLIIGLTNKGHVLKFDNLAGPGTVQQGRWEYLPLFSEVGRVRAHPTFSPSQDSQDEPFNAIDPPEVMHVTHISAHFNTFIAYSTGASSIVLMGSTSTTSTDSPKIIPALQHKSVISVILGDYHYGALTSTGKLYTWGSFSKGALGLGDPVNLEVGQPGGFAREQHRLRAQSHRFGTPPNVDVPTEVKFDYGLKKPRNRFCFAASAAGWHTGALVIDLDEEEDQEEEDPTVHSPAQDPSRRLPGLFPTGPLPHPVGPHMIGRGGAPLQALPLRGRGVLPFRVGYPGRGMGMRGRGEGGRGPEPEGHN